MTVTLQETISAFAKESLAVAPPLGSDNALFARLSAMIAVCRGARPTAEQLQSCRFLFGNSRRNFDEPGDDLLPLLAMLIALDAVPEKRLHRILEMYTLLKTTYVASPFVLLGACMLSEETDDRTNLCLLTDNAHTLFTAEQERHPLVTGYDDLCLCLLHVLGGFSPEDALARIAAADKQITLNRLSANSEQTLTHLVALSDHPDRLISRMTAVCEALKAQKLKFSSGSPLLVLPLLAACPEEPDLLAGRIVEANQFLKLQDGFSFLAVSKQERHLFAALLVAFDRLRTGAAEATRLLRATVWALFSANLTDSLQGFLP